MAICAALLPLYGGGKQFTFFLICAWWEKRRSALFSLSGHGSLLLSRRQFVMTRRFRPPPSPRFADFAVEKTPIRRLQFPE